MALIKCSECGQMISDKATKCPKCGCPTKVEMVRHQEDVARDMPVNYEEESHTNKWLYVIIALLLAVLAGGGYWWYGKTKEHEADLEIQQFVSQFVKAIQTNDSLTIRKLYPDAANADSLSVPSLEYMINKINEANHIKVEWNKDVWMVIFFQEKEGWKITSSQGLFAWPDDVMEFAKKTGQWKAGLTDKDLSIRMNDKDFVKTIIDEFCSNFKKKVMQKGSLSVLKEASYELDDWKLGITIANSNDVQLSGNDYKVTMRVWDQYLYNNNLDENEAWSSISIQGKDVAPNGETILTHSFEGQQRVKDNTVKIQWNISCQQLFNKYFVAKGDEYEKYLESKKQ